MLLWIQHVLTAEELLEVRRIAASGTFESGKKTAGVLARDAKENLELRMSGRDKEEVDRIVLEALRRNQTFEAAARPERIVTPILSRYTPGMSYGSHLDNAVMGRDERIRVDLSLTLFLSDPESYDGGELSVDTEYGSKAVKLPAGDAVLYPTTYYHQVRPVTRGERLACITWIQSLVRDQARRQILYDLSVLAEWVHAMAPDSPQFRQFTKIQLNLYRMWAGD